MRLLVVALIACTAGGCTFHYFKGVNNQPLDRPVRVRAVAPPDILELEDGRRIRLSRPVDQLENRILQSENEVEVVPTGPDVDGVTPAEVYVKDPIGYCGTPWARPIQIRLIPDRCDLWMRSKLE